MRFSLPEKERKLLREIQRNEKYKRDYVKVTVLLMLDLGEKAEKIALFLGIDDGSVYRHRTSYREKGLDGYLENNYSGYWGKLSSLEISRLRTELNTRLYETAEAICGYVRQEFGVEYRAEGIVPLLHRIGFSYKKTKQVPARADEAEQAEFVAEFEQLQLEREPDEVHYFVDAVHPTLNSEASYGWIEKGKQYQILSNSGRSRMNILGAINANDVTDLITDEYKTINFEAAADFFRQISQKNPTASKIKVFMDNAGYFKKMVKEGLIQDKRIEVKWLPTYSPNLNLIERLWKFFKKTTLKNKYHGTAKGFREQVREFFANIKEYKTELESLLTCNFRLVHFSQSIY